jgi:endo-alpha-1,4-polygalactosaminidase (GH114 family)
MLDTIDTPAYLESKDPREFAGSRQALREFLARLRSTFPAAVIVANGTEGLIDASAHVDGYVVESVFATHDGRDLYRATDQAERSRRLATISGVLAAAPKPLFSIDYAGPDDRALATLATREASARGFRPFVGVRALDRLPSPSLP